MKLHILNKLNVNKVLLFIFIMLFAYSAAEALLAVMRERTLGSIFRHGLQITPYLCLIILISLYDIRRFSFSSLVPVIPSKHDLNLILKRFLLISFLAVLLGIFTSRYLVDLAQLYTLVIILVITALIFSCYYMLMDRKLLGVIIFLVTIPFLYFIQNNLGQILDRESFEGLKISGTVIPLSACYLLTISIFFLIEKYKSEREKVSNDESRVIKISALFVLVAALSILFSKDPSHSFVFYLIDIFLPFIYFLILLKSLRNVEDIRKFILSLIFFIICFSFFSLYFISRKGSLIEATSDLYTHQYYGFSAFALMIVLPLQLGIYRLIQAWQKPLIGLSVIFSIVFIYFSDSRVAMVCLLISFGVFFYYYKSPFIVKMFFFVILLICLVGALYILPEKYLGNILDHRVFIAISDLFSGEPLTDISTSRLLIWQSALEMIWDFPIFGIGPDMWSQYIPEYSRTNYIHKGIFAKEARIFENSPHNIMLKIWLDYGIATFVFFMVLVYLTIKRGLRNIKNSSSEEGRNLSVILLITIIVWFVWSNVGGGMFYNGRDNVLALIFWSLIAVIFKLCECKPDFNTQGE